LKVIKKILKTKYYFSIPIEYILSGKINPEKENELQISDITT